MYSSLYQKRLEELFQWLPDALSNGIIGQQNLKFLFLLTVAPLTSLSHSSQPTCQHSLVLLFYQTLLSPSVIKIKCFHLYIPYILQCIHINKSNTHIHI